MSDSLWPFGLEPARLLYPGNSPGKNTGVDCHSLQWIFPTQGSKPYFLHCKQILDHLSHEGSSQEQKKRETACWTSLLVTPGGSIWSIVIFIFQSETWKWKSLSPVWLLTTPSTVGILQARILEGIAFPFSRGSSQPRDQTQVSCIAGRFFTRMPICFKWCLFINGWVYILLSETFCVRQWSRAAIKLISD